MIKTRIFLKNVARLLHHPFPVQGFSGRIYGQAMFSNKHAGHVLEMEFDPEITPKFLEDIVRGSHRPNSQWFLCSVEAISEPTNAEMELAQLLDEVKADLHNAKAELASAQEELRQLRTTEHLDKPSILEPSIGAGAAINAVPEDETIADEPIEPPAPSIPPATREGLQTLTFRQLRSVAKEMGLDTTGITETDMLIDRILTHESQPKAAN